jgi:ubiquinone/menaquinone biosynthesis C-methylase UbiE
MDYNEKFKNRIEGYMYASSKYPKVLENENLAAVRHLNPEKGDKILHIAAAGVNIKNYIDIEGLEIELVEVDQNEEFARIGNIDCINLEEMPYDDNTFNKAIVIANFHHSSIEEREKIYKEVFRVLKPGGKFVLGDVMKHSLQDSFLNKFVDKYNPNGHNGLFFSLADSALFNSVGFRTSLKMEEYTWNFDSMLVFLDFCYNFFHLTKLEKNKLYSEIKKYLIVKILSDNSIEWKWRLLYFTATVPDNKK